MTIFSTCLIIKNWALGQTKCIVFSFKAHCFAKYDPKVHMFRELQLVVVRAANWNAALLT